MNSTIEHFIHLLKHNHRATSRAANSIVQTSGDLLEAVKLLSHLISSQLVKRAGGIPAVTDYIVYQRELQDV